jgi:hypothetical protein
MVEECAKDLDYEAFERANGAVRICAIDLF